LWHQPLSLASVAPAQLAFWAFPSRFLRMPERIQKPLDPAPWGPKQGDGGGPRSPDVSRPDTKDLLKKMRKVDPNQSKRYRQRTGE
jgi:hypothetical protein